MIITEDFICLNNPKTGSTYAREAIRQLYPEKPSGLKRYFGSMDGQKWHVELKNRSLQFPDRPKNQHGAYSQIPEKYLNREIVSVVRNPYDKFLSAWEYKYWLKQKPSDKSLKTLRIKDLNNITIDDFCKIQISEATRRFKNLEKLEIGTQTIQFIFMFFKEPEKVISQLSDDYFKKKLFRSDMPEIFFLNQANLTEELFNYVEKFNPKPDHVQKAKLITNVNVNKKRKAVKDFKWTNFSLEYVSHFERYLFDILEDYGLYYEKPSINK